MGYQERDTSPAVLRRWLSKHTLSSGETELKGGSQGSVEGWTIWPVLPRRKERWWTEDDVRYFSYRESVHDVCKEEHDTK